MVHIVQINARATYGLSFGGSSPHIFLPDSNSSSTVESLLSKNDNSNGPLPNNREWTLYLPKAYHPLLLQNHRENVQKAKEDVNLATSVKSHDMILLFFFSLYIPLLLEAGVGNSCESWIGPYILVEGWMC